ncbi:MAG TPA: sigma 54-interacting transcriptional regulator [Polyangia bacterium]|nr:sigma 54-interacting transcriptional regulator [Polyangia bacterium]
MPPDSSGQLAHNLSPDIGPATQPLTLLLDISRAAAALDLPALIDRVGSCLQRGHWNWDHTSLCLHEPAQNALRVHHLFFGPGPLAETHRRNRAGDLIPIAGTQSGRAFTTGQPSVTNTLAQFVAMSRPAWAAKILQFMPPNYSSCIVPLISRGRTIGTFAAADARDSAFDGEAVQLLCQIADIIAPAVDNALAYREIEELKDRLSKENGYLKAESNAAFGEIVGGSPALQRVLGLIESVARSDSTVLIHGETGTGKELVAHAIHRLSRRRGSTFVTLNCAALAGGLLESELFGHERGAFTGAASQKVGRFELAHHGTFFLDEVGEIPLDVQPKLLRVLQDREFERLGGTRTLRVDARLIAATNRDLAQMRADGSFRSDLFYRLNVFPILVPPLRQRTEDIPLLVRHFVERSARRLGKKIDEIPAHSMDALSRYDWPGNVRELANVIERAVILATSPALHVHTADLEAARVSVPRGPAASSGSIAVASDATPERLVDVERSVIKRTLEDTNWIVGGRSGAATRLGLSRTTLQARIRRLGITRPR